MTDKDANANANEDHKDEDHQVDIIHNYLQGKSIALCVSGGIAAIETPKIARHLRRMGAEVRAYMTPESGKFVGKASLEWGTGNAVVDQLSGLAEHICREDAVVVAPATLNTIDKIFSGIADNPVTTLVASALGQRKPVLLAPCMHASLYDNPFFQENMARVRQYGIGIVPPRFSEGKAKIASLDHIVADVSRSLSADPLKGKRVLVTAGPTPVHIDDVRVITNAFRGTLGVKIASELYHRGADVKLLLGGFWAPVPSYINVTHFKDYDGYYDAVFEELEKGRDGNPYDIGIFSAAVADYMPDGKRPGKIESKGTLSVDFVQTKKVIDDVRTSYPGLYMATFKFTIGKSRDELLAIAKERAGKYQLVVANRGEEMNAAHPAYIVDVDGVLANPVGKDAIAKALVDVIGKTCSR